MIKYSPKEREDWARQFQPKLDKQEWQNNIVWHPSDMLWKDFFCSGKTIKKKINPRNICGLRYAYAYNCPSYKYGEKINWKYMLHYLKRLDWVIDNLLTREKLIDHIHNNPEGKAVHQYGNHYFTIAGQHRLYLAKLLELDEVEVEVHQHSLNKKLLVGERMIENGFDALQTFGLNEYKRLHFRKHEYIPLEIDDNYIQLPKTLVSPILKKYSDIQDQGKMRLKLCFGLNFFRPKRQHQFKVNKEADIELLNRCMINHIVRFGDY